jgi:hypothetical protein
MSGMTCRIYLLENTVVVVFTVTNTGEVDHVIIFHSYISWLKLGIWQCLYVRNIQYFREN